MKMSNVSFKNLLTDMSWCHVLKYFNVGTFSIFRFHKTISFKCFSCIFSINYFVTTGSDLCHLERFPRRFLFFHSDGLFDTERFSINVWCYLWNFYPKILSSYECITLGNFQIFVVAIVFVCFISSGLL